MQRYALGQGNVSAAKVELILRDIADIIENGNFRTRRDLLIAVRQTLVSRYNDLGSEMFADIEEFAGSEVGFYVQLLQNASTAPMIATPSMQDVLRSVANNPIDVKPGRSVSIRQAIDSFGLSKVRQVELALLDGASDTQQQLAKRVRKLIPLNRNQAGALARTAQNATSSIAAYKTFAGNLDVLDGYQWVSTLDGSTSFICMTRDGEVYKFHPASPMPPAHWGCRSVIVPKVKRRFDLGADADGLRPSVGSGGTQEVSTKTTYAGWLRRQGKSFIDEKLGPTRSKLYREGKLTIDKFTDDSGRVYTLRQLEALNPVAFSTI